MKKHKILCSRNKPAQRFALPALILLLVVCGCSKSSETANFTNAVGSTPSPAPTLAPGQKPNYKVEVKKIDGVQMVNVTFSGRLPPPEQVDKILRTEFEKVVSKNPKIDALGYAYLGDDDLTDNQFGGNLFYRATMKRILTQKEFEGTKTSTEATDSYLVVIEEDHTMEGITPRRTWLSISLVFPQIPPQNVAYESMIREIDKAKSRGLDINAYVKVGDKNKKTSWYQVKDSDGAFIFANYETKANQITRRGKVLKAY